MHRNSHRRRNWLTAVLVLVCTLLLAALVSRANTQDRSDPPPALVDGTTTDVAMLVKTTHTSQFSPPSPDPAGIAYLPASRSLLISDSEVNEIEDLFTGDNLFEVSLGGNLLRTLSTIAFSDEPTGVAFNPANNHLFFSDDVGSRGFYEVDPGPDGLFDTADDVVTFIDMQQVGAQDPEGITYDTNQGHLFVADGFDGVGTQSIFEIDPGSNDVFDGAPPDGDDIVTQFDALALGIRDPEGVAFNPDNGHLYVLSGRDFLIAETLTDGTLLRYIDVSGVNGSNLGGLAYAPASDDPTTRHLYIVDRGVDNDTDPEENDGVLYEVAFPLNVDNLPPAVDAGPDQFVYFVDGAMLKGFADDDGNPDPPGALTTTWSKAVGPGTVNYTDANALDTAVSFSTPGVYVLRLTADDGQLTAFDEVTILVRPPGSLHIPVYVFEMVEQN